MTLGMYLAEAAAQTGPAKAAAAVANNFQVALLAFKAGGWIVALIGAAAMVGRLLVDEAADASWLRSLRHVLAASIFAIIAYFVTFQWELSALNKAIVQGLCGAVAPELVDWLSTTIRKKLGFKDKGRTPAWKNLFSRAKKKKKKKRGGTSAGTKKVSRTKVPARGAAKSPATKKPAASKPPAKGAAKKKPSAKKSPSQQPKPGQPKAGDSQETLNL